MAEHGVGRNPIKQELLRDLNGEQGIDEMRHVKRAIDPEWKLALTVCHSTCSPVVTKQVNGGVDGTRTRGLRRDRAAF